jgi:hypothetical protein
MSTLPLITDKFLKISLSILLTLLPSKPLILSMSISILTVLPSLSMGIFSSSN